MIDRLFDLTGNETTLKIEAIAGLTTFLTMAYIIFVNPSILAETGMDKGAVFVATCLAAAIGTAIMGLYANYPVALAPGMGLNAYFTYGVVLGMGYSWQTALGGVFVSGLLFIGLSVLPIREWIINAIPRSLKMSIAAGIGFFLAIIALKNAGFIVSHPATLVTLGDLSSPSVLLAAGGFLVMAALSARNVPGAILISILGTAAVGMVLGISEFSGIFSAPPSIIPTFMQMDLAGVFETGMLMIIFAFLFVDLFDTAGTLVAVGHQAKLIDENGRLPRIRKALLADSTATVAGAALGTSSTTSYIESAAGINAGGRTGLTALVVAIAFLLCLFLSPLAGSIPPYATAPALLFVACLMVKSLIEVDWDDLTEAVPAVITAITMPLTFSIATGIGCGFIAYASLKILSGNYSDAKPAIITLALAFVAKFAIL